MIPADPLRNLGPATILRANARHLPLADNSVDLVVTSPPYFALRSYQDSCATCGGITPNDLGLSGSAITSTLEGAKGERSGTKRLRTPDPDCPDCHGTGKGHYAGQLGSEATPAEFVDALIACTREMVRVVKPSGSIWVNLGDKYNSHNNPSNGLASTLTNAQSHAASSSANRRNDAAGYVLHELPKKSLMGIPWRYALRCIDDLGLILRAHVVWSKPNGLPESVTDRVRRSHEDWFHFTLEPRYYSAVDEIREPHLSANDPRWLRATSTSNPDRNDGGMAMWRDGNEPNPLGKLPGSVWTVPTEPLRVPDHLGVDHFAAFPSEWPKRIIRGWSPAGVCTACGEGRRPVVDAEYGPPKTGGVNGSRKWHTDGDSNAKRNKLATRAERQTTITGYACACPQPTAPTTPSLILDPFGGTGTVAMVARALGRHGVHVDLSADYNRLAYWRITNLDQLAAVQGHQRTKRQPDDQPTLLDEIPEVSA